MDEALGKLATQGVLGVCLALSLAANVVLFKLSRDEAKAHMETLRSGAKEMNAATVALAVQSEKQRASIASLIAIVKSLYRLVARDSRGTLTPGAFPAVGDEDET